MAGWYAVISDAKVRLTTHDDRRCSVDTVTFGVDLIQYKIVLFDGYLLRQVRKFVNHLPSRQTCVAPEGLSKKHKFDGLFYAG